ncbi:ATP-binding protein [Pseudomonas sp. FW305-3-2-15-E-TSA4]|nr:ATP-binding protein [Pseudomonas sp. FW305-3-2-15-E-TSA4]
MSDTAYADSRSELESFLASADNEGQPVQTKLQASDRVIARVTDGIYREPASALRELISNAWDADANTVTILTDAPRFSRIYVRDDGQGMSHQTLSRLVKSIGGSAKRQSEGAELGITDAADPSKTKGGRPIIGKIGIGLFSVSQLARRFRIVTKMADRPYRLIAEIQLRQLEEPDQDDSDDVTLSGTVTITREGTSDLAAHGTDILLDDLKPAVRDILRDAERWRAVENREEAEQRGDWEEARQLNITAPRFHSGWISGGLNSAENTVQLTRKPQFPWSEAAPASDRMRAMLKGIEDQFSHLYRPDLENTFDYYLQMVWSLGLAAPVPYVDGHPFDLTAKDRIRLYWLSNAARDSAIEVPLAPGQTVRQAVARNVTGQPKLTDGLDHPAGEFRVLIDGIELRRPVSFKFHQSTERGLQSSILMVGRYAPDLSRVAPGQSGGALELEGYLFWNGRIIPKENNGVLVRIRGASGALFDRSFFSYPVLETQRLRQITSELFVKHGLDAALNIDRESFNFAHPHFQLVSTWLHRALRQVTNRQKELTARLREERQATDQAATQDAILQFAQDVWQFRQGSEPPPDIAFTDSAQEIEVHRRAGGSAFDRRKLTSIHNAPGAERAAREVRASALVQVLTAYGLLEALNYDEQQSLIDEILQIFLERR